MKYSLGVDPGKNGAAVLLGDRQLVGAWWWKPVKAGGYAVMSLDGATTWASLGVLARQLPTLDGIAVEGLFVGAARQRIIGTAETAGELLGALAVTQEANIKRPMASEWRGDLLRLGPTKAAECDKYAKKVVLQVFGESPAWKSGHCVDAACIALWAAGVRGRR